MRYIELKVNWRERLKFLLFGLIREDYVNNNSNASINSRALKKEIEETTKIDEIPYKDQVIPFFDLKKEKTKSNL